MASRIIHCCVSLRGALMNWKDREWSGVVRDESGRLMTALEVKAAFLDHLAQGVELIPFGGPCEGFDPKTGCPGHEIPEPESEASLG